MKLTRKQRRVALAATGVLVAGGLAGLPASQAFAATACDVQYAANSWGTGFTADVTIRNLGDPLTSWTLRFNFTGNQQITNGWSANWSQSGQAVTATNAAWNGNLSTGGSTSIGFQATYSGSNANPTSFSINGTACNGVTPTTPAQTTGGPTSSPTATSSPTVTTSPNVGGPYGQEFLALYNKLKDPASGYFSPEGVPYHSIETLLVEAPDHGHETTSEAFSYWLFLEAQYGRVSGDWSRFNSAWNTLEQYIIPTETQSGYNANDPADYAAEAEQPSLYPQQGGLLDSSVPVGQDPLYNELTNTYGSNRVYGMHWLLDVDNTYGYGKCGDHSTRPAYINTYQRGPQESVWETVPHPSCETFSDGQQGNGGYLPLFISDASAQQWRYTNAPDADARAVQASYWALQWATEQGKAGDISASVTKAAKMGDYLRYAMYDKYFKNPGCASTSCTAGTGKSSSAYLLAWYYAWGGPQGGGGWAWRIGASHNHGGYQNPFAAYVLSNVNGLIPQSPTAQADWQTSLDRQIQFYTWLQSNEGAIAGGATNSVGGAYGARDSGLPTFYGMQYDWQPVYHDPPSNQWFGFQAWSMERVAEYYYVTNDAKAKALLDKWVAWALEHTTIGTGGDYQIPSTLSWTGQPGGNWSSGTTSVNNGGLHVSVVDRTNDVGVAGAYARTLIYYGAKANNAASKTAAKGLLDGVLAHKDAQGVSVAETRLDYNRFDDVWTSGSQQGLYIPSGHNGTMPNGDVISAGKSFIDIRSWYRNDPDWPKVQAYLDGGSAPSFNYHRFWAQVDVALALADYDRLLDS